MARAGPVAAMLAVGASLLTGLMLPVAIALLTVWLIGFALRPGRW